MKKQRGIALILVLTLLTVLIGLASNYILSISRETEALDILNNRTQARYSALAGIQYAQFAMQEPDQTKRWLTDGTLYRTTLADSTIYALVKPESGRIDINGANTELLALLFEFAGLSAEQAQQLADNVAHWRQREDIQVGQSVFDIDYESDGRPLPAHRPFYVTEEITQVYGVSLSVYRKIRPLITVFGSNRVNLLSASGAVMQALQLTDEDIAAIRLARQDYQENQTPLPGHLLNLSPFTSFNSRDNYYRVLSYAEADNGSTEAIYAVIKNRRNQQGLFQEMRRDLLSGQERADFLRHIQAMKADSKDN